MIIKKILIINPFGIGDVVFSTPLIEILKNRFPGSFIGYLCNRRVSELIATNPKLDTVFVYEKDEYRDAWQRSKIECSKKIWAFLMTIKKERFDISIDLSLGYQNSMFLKLIGIRRRLGFNYRDRGVFLTDKITVKGFDRKHVVDYYLDVLALLIPDIKRYEAEPKLYASPAEIEYADKFFKSAGIEDRDMVIGLIPGCGASWGLDANQRRWDKANFAILADRLIEKYGAKIMLLGSAKETAICDAVQRSMSKNVINHCGRTSMTELVGILAKCKAVVTNDGGPLHMAAGLGVKTVSIFGPVDESIYGPRPAAYHLVMSKKDLACRPCYRNFKYSKCDNRLCLSGITVDEVLDACEKALG